MTIFVEQEFALTSTITKDGGTVVDISGQTVVFDYWLPGNKTDVPDDNIPGTIISGPDGTVAGIFPDTLNTKQGTYKFQARVTIGGKTYRGEATCTIVRPIGWGCSS